MKPAAALLLTITLLLAACGDDAFSTSTRAPGTTATTATGSTTPAACGYYDVAGCALYGLVLPEPEPTAAALAAVAELPGVAVAVWRADLTCVLQTSMGMPGPVPTEPSRFA